MAMTIELSDSTIARLQKLAVPLIENFEGLINRLAEFYEQNSPEVPKLRLEEVSARRRFDPISPPDLRHTKIRSAKFGKKQLANPNWNGLMIEAIRSACTSAATAAELKRLVIVPYTATRKEDEGYKYFPEIKMSVQGQDANSAWKAAFHVAQQLRLPIEVEFIWRQKQGAAHPGEVGRLSSG
jgi:hypothetical protein